MNTFAKNLRWFATLSLAALMIAAILAANASASVSWTAALTSPAGTWSNGANWSSSSAPGTGDDVIFTTTGGTNSNVTNTNTVDGSFTNSINSLWYQQQGETSGNYVQSTSITGTLKVTGSFDPAPGGVQIIGCYGLDGPISLMVGNLGTSTTVQSWAHVTGATSTLDVSGVGGVNTGGDIVVRECQTGGGGSDNAQLDLTGLGTFNANVDQLLIGYAQAYNSSTGSDKYDGERNTGVMYLANSNTITLNKSSTAYGSNVLDAGLYVGYARHNANANTNPDALYLGHSNTINVDDVVVGARRKVAYMTFNPATVSGAGLTMRGAAGLSTSRVDQIVIGDNCQIEAGTGTGDAKGTVTLTGASTIDILATSIILGRTASATGTTTGRCAFGTLAFDAGTIDTTGLIAGDEAGNWVTVNSGGTIISATGVVNVSGAGTLKFGSAGIILGQTLGTTTSPATGILNIAGNGTLQTLADGLGADIMDGGGISTLTLTGGTIDMAGHLIGGLGTPIDTVTLGNGIVENIRQINAGTLTINAGVTLGVSVSGPLSNGSSYDILNWADSSESGTFATVNLPALDPGLFWDTSKLYVDGTIQVIPEPAALLMLIVAAGLGLMLKRFRD